MKVVFLLVVVLTAMFTANCREQVNNFEDQLFPDEPGEDYIFPDGQVDDAFIGEAQHVSMGSENQNIGEEDQQMNKKFDMGSASDLRASMTERGKKCTPSLSCTRAGGHCVKKRGDCDGSLDRNGCKGSKNCQCCIPDKVATVSPTCPATSCPTCPATSCPTYPATSCPTCPTTSCPTCPATSCPTCPSVTSPTCPSVTSPTCPSVTSPTCPEVTCATEQTTSASTLPPSTTTEISLPECTGGIMMMNQCFRIFTDARRNWVDALSKCRSENLILAEPSDSVAAHLNQYILENYGGGYNHCWIGASGDGSKFVWQYSGEFLFGNNSLWRYGPYSSSSYMSTSRCLLLLVHQSYFNSYPGKPYLPQGCTSRYWTVCEEVKCPKGFLVMNQCFRIFNDTQRSWDDAQSKCQSENLTLAEPSDSVAAPLRQYVLENFGTGNYQCWLGARGDGSKFIWQHSGDFLFNNNTLLDYGYLSSNAVLTSHCLELDAWQPEFDDHPRKPYDSVSCTSTRWTLCQELQ